MDNDFHADEVEFARTVASHDVIAIRFVTTGQRLLLDFRCTEFDGPLVRVVPPVRSARERYETLRRLRPRFELPDRIVAVAWPRFARSLGDGEAWEAVQQRIEGSGHPACMRDAEAALTELQHLERETHRRAVTGQGFRTLWSASARQR